MRGREGMKVLMSIKPKYADKIFSGEKKWEYRKQPPKLLMDIKSVVTIVVYASAPISKVIGEFTTVYMSNNSVNRIWYITGNWGGVSAKEFLDYFGCAEKAYAIRIREKRLYDTPKPLSDYGIKRPPQNFMYLKEGTQ
jgi:predicted transcriptional regulator